MGTIRETSRTTISNVLRNTDIGVHLQVINALQKQYVRGGVKQQTRA